MSPHPDHVTIKVEVSIAPGTLAKIEALTQRLEALAPEPDGAGPAPSGSSAGENLRRIAPEYARIIAEMEATGEVTPMLEPEPERTCGSVRYGPQVPCSTDGPIWDVIYVSLSTHKVMTRHAACFTHGIREVESATAAASIAQARVVPQGAQS